MIVIIRMMVLTRRNSMMILIRMMSTMMVLTRKNSMMMDMRRKVVRMIMKIMKLIFQTNQMRSWYCGCGHCDSKDAYCNKAG